MKVNIFLQLLVLCVIMFVVMAIINNYFFDNPKYMHALVASITASVVFYVIKKISSNREY